MSILIEKLLQNDSEMSLIEGDLGHELQSIASIEEVNEGDLLFLGAPKFIKKFKELNPTSNIALVLAEDLFTKLESNEVDDLKKLSKAILTSKNIPISITKASKQFYDEKFESLTYELDGRKDSSATVHPSVKVAENVFIGEGVTIGANCTIMPGCVIMPNVTIGEACTLYPNVTIYPGTKLGSNCRVHSGTVIGSDGFGYNFYQGTHHKIWHFGGVEIGNDVEIGTNTSIDQGTFSPTRIGNGTKIDNQVQVAHNVQIGNGVILCGQVGLGGSTKIGDYAVLGGKVAVADNLEVGMAAQLAGGAIAIGNVEAKSVVGGYPARPMREWLRGIAFLRKNI